MKKKFIFSAAALAVLFGSLTSCEKEKNEGCTDVCPKKEKAELNIIAEFEAPVTRAFTEKGASWSNNDKLGVFVLNNAKSDLFPSTQGNMEYTYNSNRWNGLSVKVSNELPQVCAYYPYSSSNSEYTAIPLSNQTDLLYSTPVTPVIANSSADVRMVMKHALTQVIFNITKGSDYNGAANVTSMTLSSSTGFFKDGTINLLTGNISGTTQDASLTLSNNTPAIMLPYNGNVTMTATIDGRNYKCELSADWKSGKKITYPLTLTATELVIGGDGHGGNTGITIEPWTGANETGTLTPIQ